MIRLDPATGSYQFQHGTGWRTLSDPHGPATARQLLRLNREGLLELRTTPGEPLTKLDTAHAIDQAPGGSRVNLDAAGGASSRVDTREEKSAGGYGGRNLGRLEHPDPAECLGSPPVWRVEMTGVRTCSCGCGRRFTPKSNLQRFARPECAALGAAARQQSRYGKEHRRLRRRLEPIVAAGAERCRRCGDPIVAGEPWDLGHGPEGAYRGPEYRDCNRSTSTAAAGGDGALRDPCGSRRPGSGGGASWGCGGCRRRGSGEGNGRCWSA